MRLIVIAILSVLTLTGCSGESGSVQKYLGWSEISYVDKDEVRAKFNSWDSKANLKERLSGYAILFHDATQPEGVVEVKVDLNKSWARLHIDNTLNSFSGKRYQGVVVWVNQLNESIVICEKEECIDVSAWYKLATLEDIELPKTVQGISPEEVATFARLGAFQAGYLDYYQKLLEQKTERRATENGIESFILDDERIYITGKRKNGDNYENCAGWTLKSGIERAIYLCATENENIISGNHSGMYIKNIKEVESLASIAPAINYDLYDKFIPLELDKTLIEFGVVDKQWVELHRVNSDL